MPSILPRFGPSPSSTTVSSFASLAFPAHKSASNAGCRSARWDRERLSEGLWVNCWIAHGLTGRRLAAAKSAHPPTQNKQTSWLLDAAAVLNGIGNLSKYPPAEPEALRLLAPQRGLFATVESKGNRNSKSHVIQMARAMLTVMRKGILPELSNFYCHPGKAGGSPFCNSYFPPRCSVLCCVEVWRYWNRS